jgi:hypothetical protein
VAFYRPKQQIRNQDGDNQSDGAPGPIRDLVGDKGPMFQAGKKNVDFGNKLNFASEKTNNTQPKLMEIGEIDIDLGNENMNEVVNDIKFAREKVRARINEKSPDEEKSIKSKKGKKR